MKKYSTQDLWIRVILFFAICVILIFSFQGFVLRLVRELFNNGNAYPETLEINLVRAMNGIVGIGLVYIFLQFDRKKMSDAGLSWNKEFGWEWILLSIPITIAGFIPTILIEYIFNIVIIEGLLDIVGILLSLVIAFFAFGVGEELLFRGYLQTILESKYSFMFSAIVSAALFGLLHLLLLAPGGRLEDMFAILFSAFAMGLTFSYIFKTTKHNLIFPIAIHGFWDFFYFAFQAETTYQEIFHTVVGIFASIIGAVVIFLLFYLYTTKRPLVIVDDDYSLE
ncbi:MAG: CPBP family intramembrane metalloprotease [Candidatus Heimdallarchaeota archaeon]|nr:MAG: CPBP family intramembrane metalloprotease [Candidatus Heimdallarchaeota archaeon]